MLEDQQAFTANEILVAIRWMTRPLAQELLAELRQARHRTAFLTSVLGELFDDDTRSVPRFHNSVLGSNASAARAAPLADLRAAARAPLFGVSSEDQTAALEIAKSVKAALVKLRRNAATPLPKV